MSIKSNSKNEIEKAAAEALSVLAKASEAAASAIASAASQATNVIANAAAEASKLTAAHSTQTSADHDLLVTMKQQMEGLKEDIKNLRDDQVGKVSGHETRLNDLERSNIRQVVCISIGAIWLVALSAMLVYHLFKMPIQ